MKTLRVLFLALSLLISPLTPEAQAQKSLVTGTVSVLWGDGLPGTANLEVYYLQTQSGETFPLGKGFENLIGQSITIDSANLQGEIRREEVQINGQTAPQAVSGQSIWVSIVCGFPDENNWTKNMEFFQNQYSVLDEYWQENSYGGVTVAGSFAVGPVTLSQPKASYFQSNGYPDWGKLSQECASLVDNQVDFRFISGVNLMFPGSLGCCAWGGKSWYSNDGTNRSISTTWEPNWGWGTVSVLKHEMGHGFGLLHSAGPTGNTYGDPYDVMGYTYYNCSRASDPIYGCLGEHINAYHKHQLSWGSEVVLNPGQVSTMDLDFTSKSNPQNPVRAIALTPDWGKYITVEARGRYGFDKYKLPHEGVVIHTVESRQDPSWLFSVDNVQDSPGTVLQPGESVTVNGVTVCTEKNSANGGLTVSIGNQVAIPCSPLASFNASFGIGSISLVQPGVLSGSLVNNGVDLQNVQIYMTLPRELVANGNPTISQGWAGWDPFNDSWVFSPGNVNWNSNVNMAFSLKVKPGFHETKVVFITSEMYWDGGHQTIINQIIVNPVSNIYLPIISRP